MGLERVGIFVKSFPSGGVEETWNFARLWDAQIQILPGQGRAAVKSEICKGHSPGQSILLPAAQSREFIGFESQNIDHPPAWALPGWDLE